MKKLFKSTTVRNTGIILLSVGLFFFSKYSIHCAMEKVCDSVIVDRLVRHDVTLLMPKGALEVEVADTISSRELGLSGRKKINDDEGMLFVFDTPGRYGFWMKDMQFPLDIAWINQNGIVVYIERNVTPETYPKAFINQSEALYVLEVNAGLMEKFGLYMGSKIKIVE
jgi:uncharacterized membrane protein (UPF0127 family)